MKKCRRLPSIIATIHKITTTIKKEIEYIEVELSILLTILGDPRAWMENSESLI